MRLDEKEAGAALGYRFARPEATRITAAWTRLAGFFGPGTALYSASISPARPMSDTIVLIPARLAATRLPGKPLLDINGEPMIVHVLRRAQAAKIGGVVVATDSEPVLAAVEKAGG